MVVVDPCAKLQCNHGTCQKDRGSQAFCSCFEGYGGSRCETQIGMLKRKTYTWLIDVEIVVVVAVVLLSFHASEGDATISLTIDFH